MLQKEIIFNYRSIIEYLHVFVSGIWILLSPNLISHQHKLISLIYDEVSVIIWSAIIRRFPQIFTLYYKRS